MKHCFLSVVILLLAAVMLGACSQGGAQTSATEGTPLFEFRGCEEFAQAFADDPPKTLMCRFITEGGSQEIEVTDPAVIKKVFDALKAVNVIEETDVRVTDSTDIYDFILSDGSTVPFTFEHEYFNLDGQNYTIQNTKELSSVKREIKPEE